MKKFIALIVSVCTSFLLICPTVGADDIVATKKHIEAKTTCRDCHGTDKPKEMASTEACLSCHHSGSGGYYYGSKVDEKGNGVGKPYTESGRIREMAIHDSHQGQVRCTVCHAVHEEPSKKMHCNHCHQIKVETP